MSFLRSAVTTLIVTGSVAASGVAQAHSSISSGPAQATKSQKITVSVGHGCEDDAMKHLDTIKVRVTIPAGVTSVRALRSDFGKPTVVRSGETVTHVEWTKPAAELLDGDDAYYELTIRARVGDVAFSRLQFNVEQTCEDSTTGEQVVVNWDQPPGSTTGNPAPLLTVVPPRVPGWNKFTIPAGTTVAADDFGTFFGDAVIVWRGTAAFSSNSITMTQIGATAGVTVLDSSLAASDEIYVKY
jgi:periplasmic copper chaperone A